jgi:hypothetical protein
LICIVNRIADTQYIFYCGGYGAFDRLAARAIDIIRTKHPDIKGGAAKALSYAKRKHKQIINIAD